MKVWLLNEIEMFLHAMHETNFSKIEQHRRVILEVKLFAYYTQHNISHNDSYEQAVQEQRLFSEWTEVRVKETRKSENNRKST